MSALDAFIIPMFRAIDGNGEVIPGARLSFTEPGTTIYQTVYSDAALSIAATVNGDNEVVADSNGLFSERLFLQRKDYRVRLLPADSDTPIWDEDPVRAVFYTGFDDNTDGTLAAKPITITNDAITIAQDIPLRLESAGLKADFVGDADPNNQYSPILQLANTTAGGTNPAIQFNHANAGGFNRLSAISGNVGQIYFHTSNEFGVFDDPAPASAAINTLGSYYPIVDDTADLGGASNRFDDVYATNGTIITCDVGHKDDIQAVDVDWSMFRAVAPIRHTRTNSKALKEGNKGKKARYHLSWSAQKLEEEIIKKHGDTTGFAAFVKTTVKTPSKVLNYKGEPADYTEKAELGIRPHEMTAWVHAHVLDLKETVKQQAAIIETMAKKLDKLTAA